VAWETPFFRFACELNFNHLCVDGNPFERRSRVDGGRWVSYSFGQRYARDLRFKGGRDQTSAQVFDILRAISLPFGRVCSATRSGRFEQGFE
jgi:hypothetical protein